MDRHRSREIYIFQRFADTAGFVPDLASIEKRNPPEPDILYRVGGLQRAFELVEIIDQDHAQRVWSQLKLKAKCENAFEALEPTRQGRIRERAGNALVHIVFDQAATFRAKKQAVDAIFGTLEVLDPAFVGELCYPDDPSLPSAIRSLRVSRIDALGPFFDVDAVGALGDPTLEAIRNKCAKVYMTDYPVELLAYYELQPELPEAFWRPALESFLASAPAVPFRRIWIYDCCSNAIRFSRTLSA